MTPAGMSSFNSYVRYALTSFSVIVMRRGCLLAGCALKALMSSTFFWSETASARVGPTPAAKDAATEQTEMAAAKALPGMDFQGHESGGLYYEFEGPPEGGPHALLAALTAAKRRTIVRARARDELELAPLHQLFERAELRLPPHVEHLIDRVVRPPEIGSRPHVEILQRLQPLPDQRLVRLRIECEPPQFHDESPALPLRSAP